MQQPPGYQPQGGQQYPQEGPQYAQGGSQYQQPGQAQYGHAPYYPPQKKGVPGWAWGLIIGAIVLFCGMPVVGLAMIPLITSNVNSVEHAEADALLNQARDFLRNEYSRTGSKRDAMANFRAECANGTFTGRYYTVDPEVLSVASTQGFDAEIGASASTSASGSSRVRMQFSWETGAFIVMRKLG